MREEERTSFNEKKSFRNDHDRRFTYWWIKRRRRWDFVKFIERIAWLRNIARRVSCADQTAKSRRRRRHDAKEKLITIHVFNFIIKMHFYFFPPLGLMCAVQWLRACLCKTIYCAYSFTSASRRTRERRRKMVKLFSYNSFHCRPFSFHQLLEADIILFTEKKFIYASYTH